MSSGRTALLTATLCGLALFLVVWFVGAVWMASAGVKLLPGLAFCGGPLVLALALSGVLIYLSLRRKVV